MAQALKHVGTTKRARSGSARVTRERRYEPKGRGGAAARPGGRVTSASVIGAELVEAVWQRWSEETSAAPAEPPRAALQLLLGEAAQMALLYQAHWEPVPQKTGAPLPGFRDLAGGSILHANSGYELLELVIAIAKVDALPARESVGGSPMLRAEEVLRRIRTTLEFVFDDAAHSSGDEQLEALAKSIGRPRSHDGMAVALETYAELAEEHRVKLAKVPVFDLALLDEALKLAGALRLRSGESNRARLDGGVTTRNQLLAVLKDRVARIRRSARLLFQEHPEVARRFTSEHRRTVQREHRQRHAEEAQ